MKKLFNTEFEVSMRLLILIDSISSLNEDELTYLDFFYLFKKHSILQMKILMENVPFQ